nr:hypothetical protein [uncultured Holophaga sp.]
MVCHLREIIHRKGGPAAWQALLDRVSEPCRAAFSRPVGTFEWVDVALATELSLAYGRTEIGIRTLERGRAAAREQLTSIHAWMLRFLSPSFLMSNIPRLFHFYFRGGVLEVEHEGHSCATLHVWATGLYPEYWRFGATGWLEEALRMTGAVDVEVRYEEPEGEGVEGHHHRYHVTWR